MKKIKLLICLSILLAITNCDTTHERIVKNGKLKCSLKPIRELVEMNSSLNTISWKTVRYVDGYKRVNLSGNVKMRGDWKKFLLIFKVTDSKNKVFTPYYLEIMEIEQDSKKLDYFLNFLCNPQ